MKKYIFKTPHYEIIESNSHHEGWIFKTKDNKFFMINASLDYMLDNFGDYLQESPV